MEGEGYFRASRSAYCGFLFGLPLLLFYELLAFILKTDLRNGADVWLTNFFAFFGSVSPWVLKVAGFGALGLLLLLRRKELKVRPAYFLFMLGEAVAYSLLLGTVVTSVLIIFKTLSFPPSSDLLTQLTLSLGAGVYEELLFRVILFSGLFWLLSALTNRVTAGIVAALISSLVFSAVHYLGPLGDQFELYSFAYRFLSGLIFTGLYIARGFGITAYTHALYDVWVILK